MLGKNVHKEARFEQYCIIINNTVKLSLVQYNYQDSLFFSIAKTFQSVSSAATVHCVSAILVCGTVSSHVKTYYCNTSV